MRMAHLRAIALLLTGVVCLVIIVNKYDIEKDLTPKREDPNLECGRTNSTLHIQKLN